MSSEVKTDPAYGSANGNYDVDLLIEGECDASPETDFHVGTATAFPVVVKEGRDGGEEHEEEGVAPPRCCSTQGDDCGDTEPVNDDCADEIEEGEFVPYNTLNRLFRWHGDEEMFDERE